MKKKTISIPLLIVFFMTFLITQPSFAADMLLTNYSFESGTTGWSQSFGSGGFSASTDRSFAGSYSLKLNDASSSGSYGMESTKLAATAGTVYLANARVYVSSGISDLYIRFWNSSNTLLSSASASCSTIGQWYNLSVKATAPAGTTKVSVLAYSGTVNTGISYFDCMGITSQFTTIGSQVSAASIAGAAFGKDEFNNDVVYTVVNGVSPKFVVVNVNTSQVVRTIDLPNASGAWALAVATDGKCYVGSYSLGHLFQYTPGQSTITDLGVAVSGDTFIWDLQPGLSGKVYGGTSMNAAFFKYQPGYGFTQFGPKPVVAGESYVRSLAYDSVNAILYGGVGSHANLVRYDCNSYQLDQILPSQYSSQEFVYNLNYINQKLFVMLSPSNKTLVLSISEDSNHNVTTVIDCEIPLMGSLGVSPEINGKVYYTASGRLYYYDFATKSYGPVMSGGSQVLSPINPCEYSALTLTDQTNYPGTSMVGIQSVSGQAKIFKYNPQTGNSSISTLSLPEIPIKIQSFASGYDGKIYSSGYISGGTGVYSPMFSDLNAQYKGIGQCEGMKAIGNKLYMGVYPGAYIYEYDYTQPWSIGTNPKLIFNLSSYGQDRPFGVAGGDGKVFIGTVPQYGILGGALAIYDTATQNLTVTNDLINDQSIITLAYLNGKVYGGTSIYGGLGINPTQTSGKFFVYDIATGTKTEFTPVAGAQAVTSVIVGPDNKIWGFAEGNLFIYNPATGTIEYNQSKFPEVNYTSNTWYDARMLIGKDGYIYGTIHGKLFKIDPSTKVITTILSSNAYGIAKDDFGYIYYTDDSQTLYRYAF